MPINEDDAAVIASRHGLAVTDVKALAELARDTVHAENLAARFAAAGPPNFTTLADAGARREAVKASIHTKSIWMARVQAATDADGAVDHAAVVAAPPAVPEPATPDPAIATAVDLGGLRPGAPAEPPPADGLPERIAAAEANGDWVAARKLKAEWTFNNIDAQTRGAQS